MGVGVLEERAWLEMCEACKRRITFTEEILQTKYHPWRFRTLHLFISVFLTTPSFVALSQVQKTSYREPYFSTSSPSPISPTWLPDSGKHLSSCRILSFAMDLNHALKGKHYRGVLMNWSLKPHIPQSTQPGFWNRSLERCTDACGFPLRWGFRVADYIALPIFFPRE